MHRSQGLLLGWGWLAWAGCTAPEAVGPLPASAPGSALVEAPALSLDPSACAACHAREVSEWRKSRHSQSYTDDVFQLEFSTKRQAWCAGCHAPLAPDPARVDDQDPRALQGIGCMACHLRGGALVSSRRAPGSPHATQVDEAFGAPDFCATCHEFRFPVLTEGTGALLRYTEHPMQETVTQYRKTELLGVMDCLDCHMGPGRGHQMPGAHEGELVREALSASFCREEEGVRVVLHNHGAGHNLPSGGIDRHLVVKVWRVGSSSPPVEGFFGRRFADAGDGGRVVTSDTSIPRGEARSFVAPLSEVGGLPSEPLNVELWYAYSPAEHRDKLGPRGSYLVSALHLRESALAACAP